MFTKDQLLEKTKDELKEIMKNLDIRGLSRARKSIIVQAILDKDTDKVSIANPSKINNDSSDNILFQVKSKRINDVLDTTAIVSCGANSGKWNVVGKNVGQISSLLKEIINIPDNCDIIVNGNKVTETYVVKSNDTVEYLKVSGSKG